MDAARDAFVQGLQLAAAGTAAAVVALAVLAATLLRRPRAGESVRAATATAEDAYT